MTTIDLSDKDTIRVLWAAMCAMVHDIHAPQDQLSTGEWERAAIVFSALDNAVNA